MATPQDIARVAAELEAAENTVNTLRRKRFISSEAGAAYSAAKGRIELAEQELERLNAEYEAEQQALAGRPDLEKAVTKDIAAAQKQLEASRKNLTETATRAQQALVDVGVAAEAHNALIAQHSAALAVRGLRLEEGHDHQTGGGLKGARVRGAWWLPVDTSTLLVWVMHRAAGALLPARHHLVGSLQYAYGRHLFDVRTDRPLADVPDLPKRPTRPVVRPEPVDMRPMAFIESAERAEADIQKQLLGYTTLKAAPDGTTYTERCEAPEAVKDGVACQLAQLRRDLESGRTKARYK